MEDEEYFNYSHYFDYFDYGDYYNGTWDGPCDLDPVQSLVLGPYVHSIMCVLGLIGNGLMLVTLLCSKRPSSATQTFLLHLAVADLVLVLVLPGLVVMDLGAWPEGGVACKLFKGGYSVSLFGSALLLVAMGADRYAARARRRSRPSGLSRVVSAAVWIAAITLSLPAFICYDRYDPHDLTPVELGPDPDLDHQGLSHLDLDLDFEQLWLNDSAPDPAPDPGHARYVCEMQFLHRDVAAVVRTLVPVLQLAAGLLVPLLVMSVCYGSVLCTQLKGRGLCGERRGSRDGGQGFRRDRSVRLVLLVALFFILCHAPFNIILLWKTIQLFQEQTCESWNRLESALAICQTVALLHCVLNPLLYGLNRTAFLHQLNTQRRRSSTSQSERSTDDGPHTGTTRGLKIYNEP